MDQNLGRPDRAAAPSTKFRPNDGNIRFVDYETGSKEDWASFVARCDEAGIYHLPDFVDGSLQHFDYKKDSFSIRDDTGIVGICVLKNLKQQLGRILLGPGLAMLPEYKTSKVLALINEELRRRAKAAGCCAIRFYLDPCAPGLWRQRFADSYLSSFDFSLGVRLDDIDYESGYYIVSDLERTEAEILKGFTKGNRAVVKKCRQQGIVVTMVTGEAYEPKYWQDFELMLRTVGDRNQFATFTERQLEFLRDQVRNGRVILFNSYKDGAIIASGLFLYYKDALFYHAAGCIDEALALGAMVHLHFEAMVQAKAHNAKIYCVGPRYTNTANHKLRDIGIFKQRLGNERWDILSGELIFDRRTYYLRILLPKILMSRHLVPGLKSFALSLHRALMRLRRPA